MILIVTGGIGSGKSEVCRILRDSFGYRIYEADRKAKELYCRFPDLIERIEKALDCRIRTEYGEFAPSLLAERIFTDKEALAEVENILFTYLLKDFDEFCKQNNVRIGIITVGTGSAQNVCDKMIESGITAIWNFAPCNLEVPDGILLKQERLALSLAYLNNKLSIM